MTKIALVFGGSGGVGIEVCKRLLERGIVVFATYHMNKSKLDMISDENFNKVSCDVTNLNEVNQVVKKIKDEQHKIDILINCVGVSEEAFFVDKSVESWKKVIDTNLNSVFYACKAVVPIMLENFGGVIINVSSILGEFGIPGMVDYCAAKSAIIGFTRSLASEVARFDIRINAISPGMLNTSMTVEAQKQIGKQVKRLVPAKRFGTPNEVASLIIFLISDDAAYITGENIYVGGGLGRTLPVS